MSKDSKYCNILGCVGYSPYNDEASSEQENEWEELSLTNHTQDNSWEVLTEVESVLSFDVSSVSSVVINPVSYKDALLREGINHHHEGQKTCRRPDKMKNRKSLKYIKENETESENEFDDFGFDAFQMMEGIKYGRGGKAPQWLKNNEKTNHPYDYYRTRNANRMCKSRPKDLNNSCISDFRVWVLFNDLKSIRAR